MNETKSSMTLADIRDAEDMLARWSGGADNIVELCDASDGEPHAENIATIRGLMGPQASDDLTSIKHAAASLSAMVLRFASKFRRATREYRLLEPPDRDEPYKRPADEDRR